MDENYKSDEVVGNRPKMCFVTGSFLSQLLSLSIRNVRYFGRPKLRGVNFISKITSFLLASTTK